MTHIAEHLFAVMALIAAATFALSFIEPAMAEGGNLQVTMKVLASANARVHADIVELQQLKIAVPIGTEAYYSAGVKEQDLAIAALASGNLDFAKDHALNAMNYFKIASDMLSGVKELEQPTLAVTLNEKVAIREGRAGYLQTLAIANNVSASFADYHSAIQASESAMIRQDHQEAEEHFAHAESVLDGIQNKIQMTGDTNKEERVKAFAKDMKAHLAKIVAKAEKDSTMTGRKTLMMEATSTIWLLDNAVDIDEIIKITADSSRIQVVLREYSVVLANLETIEETKDDNSPTDDSDDKPRDNDNSGVPSNNGTGGNEPPDEESEAEKLVKIADKLEDRANDLLAESDNVVATLKINTALTLIATARIDIDAGNYKVATIALKSAENALDIAEELIR